jgi:hypothetical protein
MRDNEQNLSTVETEAEASELLSRLERQAAEAGRLEGRVQTLERELQTERDARRRVTATLKRERGAAKTLHARAHLAEQQVQAMWAQIAEIERQLALKSRPLWQKLLGWPS